MIYLDNAATTPLHPLAREAMLPHMDGIYANPSSMYKPARQVRNLIDDARRAISGAIGAQQNEIYFTSGGTEANNLAIKGILEAAPPTHRHIVTSSIEHHSVYHTCEYLQGTNVTITYVPVNKYGQVCPQAVCDALQNDTCLVSIMLANNEVGTLQPIAEIAKYTKARGIPLHTDAVQAVGHMPVDVNQLGVDLLSLSAHKFYGPKGVGALYVRKGTKIAPLTHGGMQERNRRAGTENVIGIVGMSAALVASINELEHEHARLCTLRDKLADRILSSIPHTKLNGAPGSQRLSGNVNISFLFIEGEALLLHLDMNGIYASTGSACSSGALDPSHVLMNMGLTHELANGAIRFSIGRETTDADIEALMEVLVPTVEKLRALSPLYDDYLAAQKRG